MCIWKFNPNKLPGAKYSLYYSLSIVFSLYCGCSLSRLPFLLHALFRCVSRRLHFDDAVYRKAVMNDKWRFTGLLSSLLQYSKNVTYMLPFDYALSSTVIFSPCQVKVNIIQINFSCKVFKVKKTSSMRYGFIRWGFDWALKKTCTPTILKQEWDQPTFLFQVSFSTSVPKH